MNLYPDVKLGIGPAIEDGFYYDFDKNEPFVPVDLARIEKEMSGIIKENLRFEKTEVPKKEAIKLFKELNQDYKVELINEIEGPVVTAYRQGNFVDLCRGPHIVSTGELKAFKLLSIAGAYWRGNSKNQMLQRIYGVAFETPKKLAGYLNLYEEAKKRDHRKLGKQLGLFSFHDEAPASPFYHPKGVILQEELLKFWRQIHRENGYGEVKTPLILKQNLWEKSGHWEHYREHMYFTRIEEEDFAVRPMNCPGSLLIYKEKQHSYKELPLRFAELGLVYRHELSGVLHGLFRVKSFVIDDAHIFCRPEQIKEEVISIIKLILSLYSALGFKECQLELSTRPQEYIGTLRMWEAATRALTEALSNRKIEYKVNEGEGAFYGPKIDFHIRDSLGRSWQCGTVQIDFSMPERFELEYIGEDGRSHTPVMVHRACLGSVERFLGILIEHFGGAFPVWLAPVQAVILPVSDKHGEYAREVEKRLVKEDIRVDLDLRNEKIGKKVRDAQIQKVPYMLIVGDREKTEGTVSLRVRSGGDQGAVDLNKFIEKVKEEIKEKICS